jgi:hypothetical protein
MRCSLARPHNAVPRLLAALALTAAAAPAVAQPASVTLPPDGDNQPAAVIQHLGLVKLSVDYHSPNVHAPDGTDRTGKIWGELVPWGMSNLGFGTCGDQCPWRGGANQNTVFTTSHDIEVQGQPLPAGAYGLHFLPGESEWTVIFSKSSTSWGSYFYDAKEDALRVTAKPEKSEYREWLTYEFLDRQPDRATLALIWENLRLPIQVTVPNANDLWVDNLRRELRSNPGFDWRGWQQAAQFTLDAKTHLDQGLAWAQAAVDGPSGAANFATLSTLSRLQEANGDAAAAKATMTRALEHPTAGPFDIHGFARQLQNAGKNDEALAVFELNARRFPNEWPTAFGLARGLAGAGRKAEAIEQARKAIAQAPDAAAKANIERFIAGLEGG